MKPRAYGDKEPTVSIKLPNITGLSELTGAQLKVIGAVAAGDLTSGEGQSVSDLLNKYKQTVESAELEQRIAALEKQINMRV